LNNVISFDDHTLSSIVIEVVEEEEQKKTKRKRTFVDTSLRDEISKNKLVQRVSKIIFLKIIYLVF
jgi:hypothetical protein